MDIPRFNAPIPVTVVWMFLLLEHASQRAENELYTHRTSVFISCNEMRLHAPMNYEVKAPTVTCTSFRYFLGITFVAPQLWVYYVAVCTVPIGLYHLGGRLPWRGQNNIPSFFIWLINTDWITPECCNLIGYFLFAEPNIMLRPFMTGMSIADWVAL